MGKYTNATLAMGEKVIADAEFHWKKFLWIRILMCLVAIPPIVTFLVSVAQEFFISFVIATPICLPLFILLYINYNNMKADEVTLTNQRLVVKGGIFRRRTLEFQLVHVESVSLDLPSNILDYGHFWFRGTGSSFMVMFYIKNPINFRRTIQEVLNEKLGNTDFHNLPNPSHGTLTRQAPMVQEVHDFVDLGLPSGTLWATVNVGAKTPLDFGEYFAWGETKPKDNYDGNSYEWCLDDNNGILMDSYSLIKYSLVDNITELDFEDDTAYINRGSKWCIPSREQWVELKDKCIWEWVSLNNVNGYRVKSKCNENSIFLPAAGYQDGTSLVRTGSDGNYWSRTLDSENPISACGFFFSSDIMYIKSDSRCSGQSVRPVRIMDNNSIPKMVCPDCGKHYPSNIKACPNCGCPTENP